MWQARDDVAVELRIAPGRGDSSYEDDDDVDLMLVIMVMLILMLKIMVMVMMMICNVCNTHYELPLSFA